MGLSSHPAGGYDKWTQASDIRAVLDKLGIDRADIVGHDIGTMVAYAYAARYPDKTSRLVVMDSPVPGIPPWNQIVRLPRCGTSTSAARTPSACRGRERIYSTASGTSSPATRRRSTKRPAATTPGLRQAGAMHSAFAQFLAIGQKDEADNLRRWRRSWRCRCSPSAPRRLRRQRGARHAHAATNVQELVVPNAGHWLMEEAPAATIAAVRTSSQRTESGGHSFA